MQTASEMQTTSANLDRIMSNLPNGFATFDRDWRYTYINNRLLEIVNLPREAVLGKQAWDVFPHRVGIEFYDRLNRAMTEQVEEQFEFYYSMANCWVEHRVYPTSDGIAILMTDISDRKQAELLLAEQKRLLELTASGEPMDSCLAAVCAAVSNLSSGVQACILLADAQQQTFPGCIAPAFEPSFCQGLEGAPINELMIGTCSTAVSCGEPATCADIANDKQWSQEWRNLCTAHSVLACHSTPILSVDGLPLGSLMLCFDKVRVPTAWEYQLADFGTHIASIVFERDRSNLALRQSEEEYRTLFESIDEGFCIIEMIFDDKKKPVDYRFLTANPAFVRLTGLPEDALGKTVRELVPDLEKFWFEIYGKVALTGEAARFENKSEPMNRWFDVYASRVGDAGSRRVAVVFNNITDRKQVEEALRENEQRFRDMADHAPMMVWVTDPTGYCTYLSRSWYDFSGQTEVDGMGFGWLDVTHPEDRETSKAIFLTANDRQEAFQIEYRLRRKDGEYRVCLDTACPRLGADGQFKGYIGSVIDIDDRKQTEANLAERARELARVNGLLAQSATLLEERNLELDRFVHIVSHDLKAPLRAIANLSQWIEEDLAEALSAETQQQMSLLRGRVHRMEAMIDGLLNYARAGRTDAMIGIVVVDELLAEVIDSIAPPPTFQIAIAPGMPTLRTKRLLLSQVFSNLISNGIKHHPRPDGSIRISAQERGDFYEFIVADDGAGIAPEYHDKIFMIFQTVSSQKSADSSGIGLSIVKKIIETEEGTIRLESKAGEGTTFYFTWPKKS